jgi:surface glycoprotein (TIGR04207 family)
MSGHERSRAVVLAALMVVSVFAAGIAFTGAAAAQEGANPVSQCTTIEEPGTYELTGQIIASSGDDCITITASDVTLLGNGNQIVDISDDDPTDGGSADETTSAIEVGSSGTQTTDVTVQNVQVRAFDNGVQFNSVTNGEVTGVTAINNVRGIDLQDSNNIAVNQNTLEGNSLDTEGDGVTDGGTGIALVNTVNSEVTDNTLNDNNLGIYLTGSSNNEITGNDVNGTTGADGIGLFSGSSGNIIEDNTVTNASDNGIILSGDSTDNNEVINNVANNNGDDGLNVNDADENLVRDNEFRNNGQDDANSRNGVTLTSNADNNELTDNRITGNDGYGILVSGDDTTGNLIYDNFLSQADEDSESGADNVGFAGGAADGNDADDGDDANGQEGNQFNVTPRDETNIIGGNQTGGNFYAQPGSAQGFSEACANEDGNSFCDGAADLDGDGDFNDEGSDQFPLTMNQPGNLSVEPSPVEFGEVEVEENATQTVTISNTGEGNLTVDVGAIANDEDDEFSLVNGSPSEMTLEPGESITVDIEFAPTNVGDASATLFIESDGPEGNFILDITGTGVADAPGDVDAPARTMFGEVNVSDTKTQTITVENEGDDPVTVNETDISGADADEFEVVNGGANFTLEPGDQRDVVVQFAPDSAGDKSAELTVGTENDGTETTQLSGTGVAVEEPPAEGNLVATDSVDFGEVNVGESATETVTYTNDGDAAVTVNDLSFSGPNADDFSTDQGEFTLAPGESMDVSVTFSPDSAGDASAELTASTENDGSATTQLSGTGVAVEEPPEEPAVGELEAPANTMFGNVTVGEPKTQTVTLLNDGNASVTVTQTSIVGPDGSDFNVLGEPNAGGPGDDDSSFTLAPGESADITVEYRPDGTGDNTATLVSDTANDGTERTTLTGTGVEADDEQPPEEGGPENTLTIRGTGNASDYVFSVTDDLEKSTANGANINTGDEIRRGYVADGTVGISADSYAFNGTLETIKVSDDAEVFLNGERVTDDEIDDMRNNVIEFAGTGGAAQYDFAATNGNERIQKVTANNANINNGDKIFRTTGYGEVGISKDAFGFNGVIDSLEVDGDANVYVNGRQVDPADNQDQMITIVGTGEAASYEYTIDGGGLAPSNANYANTNSNDEIDGDTKTGVVGISADSNDYNGDITSFDASGDVQVYIDGQLVDQDSVASEA